MERLNTIAETVGRELGRLGLTLATAESCTGGWIAKVMTDISGSSAWFERGFITYSNTSKQEMLDVRADTLVREGAVSEAVVREMAAGALARSSADLAVAVSAAKPVGMVCFAWGRRGHEVRSCIEHFPGDRDAVRRQSVQHALRGILELLGVAP
jgi:nicotinamide-nucleotide amidase